MLWLGGVEVVNLGGGFYVECIIWVLIEFRWGIGLYNYWFTELLGILFNLMVCVGFLGCGVSFNL